MNGLRLDVVISGTGGAETITQHPNGWSDWSDADAAERLELAVEELVATGQRAKE